MGIKFRKKIKIAPGVKLNVTAKGISSVSIGGKGVTLNTGSKKGTKLTTSLHGTGLSHTQNLSSKNSESGNSSSNISFGSWLIIGFIALIIYVVIFR